jgi:hypothetical protein
MYSRDRADERPTSFLAKTRIVFNIASDIAPGTMTEVVSLEHCHFGSKHSADAF